MSINKKRIAQRQEAAKKAAKQEANKHRAAVIGLVVTIVAAVAVFGIGLWLIFSGGSDTYYADIDIQDYGTVTVELDPEAAPITCENFIELAESGFYDGLTFHRIIDQFMIQGGDPEGNGTGGSDKEIKGEFSANGVDNPLTHTRGTISMARSKHYDSASSQFFIVHQDSPHLDGKYAAFGHVVSGMDVVDQICVVSDPIDSNGSIAPEEQPVIRSVTIREG